MPTLFILEKSRGRGISRGSVRTPPPSRGSVLTPPPSSSARHMRAEGSPQTTGSLLRWSPLPKGGGGRGGREIWTQEGIPAPRHRRQKDVVVVTTDATTMSGPPVTDIVDCYTRGAGGRSLRRREGGINVGPPMRYQRQRRMCGIVPDRAC